MLAVLSVCSITNSIGILPQRLFCKWETPLHGLAWLHSTISPFRLPLAKIVKVTFNCFGWYQLNQDSMPAEDGGIKTVQTTDWPEIMVT